MKLGAMCLQYSANEGAMCLQYSANEGAMCLQYSANEGNNKKANVMNRSRCSK